MADVTDPMLCPLCAAPVQGYEMRYDFTEERSAERLWPGGPLIAGIGQPRLHRWPGRLALDCGHELDDFTVTVVRHGDARVSATIAGVEADPARVRAPESRRLPDSRWE